jgi:glycosyltransferase involved in cell wall biosynthesis
MTAPRVSVVMPVRDGATYLVQALESVLDQSVKDIEVVVVDDGSTDATPEILRALAAGDARLRVETQSAKGLTEALNKGWRASSAPYVARLDADDVALPGRLAAQARFLDDHPRVGVVGSAYFPLAHDGTRLPPVHYPVDDATLRRDLQRHNCLPHPTVMVRRAALEEAGGYRLDQAEDYDLWLRIAERHELANLPEPYILYRHHAGQFSVDKLERQALGALAVRKAASLRARGLPDPLDGVERLDADVLARLDISREELARAVDADRLTWAGVLAEVGDEDGALRLLADSSGSVPTRRQFLAASRLYRGKTAYRAGRRGLAFRLIATAGAASPRVVVHELRLRAARALLGLLRRD